MQFILILPLDIALILFLFCAIAPIAFIVALPAVISSMVIAFLPYIGFAAMCLLTLQIYIWAFTKKPENE